MNDKQSFWTTIPGILTGAAAVITAIGGLLLTLSQTGVLGSKNRDATIAKKVEIETVDRVASNGLSADKSSADENLIAVAGQESISADDQSMSREPSAPMTGEINLILADNGGQILAATSDAWLRTIDGEESGFVFNESGLGAKTEAVFAFKDERAATFYKFTVPIFKTMDENIKDFELLWGNESPTGKFHSIGKFRTQNLKLFKTPYQVFEFPPVTSKYFKVRLLSTYSISLIHAQEFELWGRLEK